jgi:hypothetical protein
MCGEVKVQVEVEVEVQSEDSIEAGVLTRYLPSTSI